MSVIGMWIPLIKDKILSVRSKGISEVEVIRKVQEAGFKIELLNQLIVII